MNKHAVTALAAALLWAAQIARVAGFVCFSEYEVSWCLGEDCSNSYTFSASHYHNKLLSFYRTGKRPPLKEAYFITRTPPDFLKQMIEECPAVPALSYALLAHTRVSMGDVSQGDSYKQTAIEIFNNLKPLQQQIMLHSWPINNALMAQEQEAQIQRPGNSSILVLNVPACGRSDELTGFGFQNLRDAKIDFAKIHNNCRTDFEQAIITLANDAVVDNYDYVFLVTGNENPGFMFSCLQSATLGALPKDFFVSLGASRRIIAPNVCAGGGLTGNYIGGFVVGKNKLNDAKSLIKSFVQSKPEGCDLATVDHMLFGEKAIAPMRPDDTRLPAGLRLKHGDEHVRNKWTDVEFGPVVPSRPIELPERGRRY